MKPASEYSISADSRDDAALGSPPVIRDARIKLVFIVRERARWLRRLSPRNKILASVWFAFVVLVAAGVHGSSTGATAMAWMPEKAYTGVLLGDGLIPKRLEKVLDGAGIRTFLMQTPRRIRWDEYFGGTPLALSQLAQSPRFPVINKSIGADGENVLLTQHAPVLHIAALARPATWGYFFLGAQRGLAWYWWFQSISCFTVLTLLLEIVLKGNWKLAVLGAFLFCSSAYVVCWSLWPAYVTMFAAASCLSAYHLMASQDRRTLWLSAGLLALALPGFVLDLYPPWQVPLVYFFAILFGALAVRDSLFTAARTRKNLRLPLALGALAIAAVVILAWRHTCAEDLHVMAQTVYPGKRVSVGGDLTFGSLFRGTYNLVTSYEKIAALKNESEASSFYLMFPAVIGLVMFSASFRRRFGVVGWSLTAYLTVLLYFLLVGLPRRLARTTLLAYIPTMRADLAVGLVSVFLCLHALSIRREARVSGEAARKPAAAIAVGVGMFLLFVLHSLALHKLTGTFPQQPFGLLMALVMGGLGWAMAAGYTRVFAVGLGSLQLVTTLLFNPIATNLDHIYHSELAEAITEVRNQTGEPSMWVTYGGLHTGLLLQALGERSLTGIQWPPQLRSWAILDPEENFRHSYNRFAEIHYVSTPDDEYINMTNPSEGALWVTISPTNRLLKQLGVRYALFFGPDQNKADQEMLKLVLRSEHGHFSIYEIP
jgi:hypothetical protein